MRATSGRGAPKLEVRETVLRDGTVTRSFSVRWFTPRGERKRRSFRDRAEAELFALVLRRTQLTLSPADRLRGDMTLDEFWPIYRADLELNVSRHTVDGYERTYDRYIRQVRTAGARPDLRPRRPLVAAVPRLGPTPLVELTTRKVSLFRTALLRAGVGPETTRRVLLLLQAMCRYAVELDEIPVNPVREVRKPRQGAGKTVHPLTPPEVEAIRRHFVETGDVFSWALVGVMAYAGPRPGEALGLELRHVRERTILIEQAVRDGVTKPQKTGRVNRSVDLIPLLRDDLATYSQVVGSLPAGRLFANRAGEWFRTDDWRNWRHRRFEPAVAAAGLPAVRPYDLRHSFASLLIREQRYAITEIAEQMGHAATMSLNTYGHVFSEYRGTTPTPASQLIQDARNDLNSAFPLPAS
jgi:integrase